MKTIILSLLSFFTIISWEITCNALIEPKASPFWKITLEKACKHAHFIMSGSLKIMLGVYSVPPHSTLLWFFLQHLKILNIEYFPNINGVDKHCEYQLAIIDKRAGKRKKNNSIGLQMFQIRMGHQNWTHHISISFGISWHFPIVQYGNPYIIL